MKNLRLLQTLVLTLFILSCSTDDDGDSSGPLNENPGISATIDGSTYDDYSYSDNFYQVTFNTDANTIKIEANNSDNDQITLFLNSTGGLDSGTVKTIGNADSNNYITYLIIRQASSQKTYSASIASGSGSITITENRAHPTESGTRLISGTFNISAATSEGNNTTFVGSFTELEFED